MKEKETSKEIVLCKGDFLHSVTEEQLDSFVEDGWKRHKEPKKDSTNEAKDETKE